MNITGLPGADEISLAGIELIDYPGFRELVLRFLLNSAVIMILIRWLYYSATRRKDYLFTYILVSTVVFLLCFLLESVKLQLGFALGLFAIFGIIRYRTNAIPIKEMTYLFLIIGVSVINALTSTNATLADLVFANAAIVGITFGLEKLWLLRHESSKQIVYEKIELIKPENYELLVKDLEERTGIQKINRAEVGRIDFLKDTCEITIYYYLNEPLTPQQSENNNAEGDDDDDD